MPSNNPIYSTAHGDLVIALGFPSWSKKTL
ncbi:Uncharacterised protein [Zhongshania aliphaticivorans]|nr:Uncharacterised protein [Zhongshania aliphaticivorans]